MRPPKISFDLQTTRIINDATDRYLLERLFLSTRGGKSTRVRVHHVHVKRYQHVIFHAES